MGEPSPPEPALRLLAAFSRHDAALAWARAQAEQAWGPVALASPAFAFRETDYYEATMGPELNKMFFVFSELCDPAEVVDVEIADRRRGSINTRPRRIPWRTTTVESRPRLRDERQIGVGFDQGSRPSDLPISRHLCRGNVVLPRSAWQHHPWTFPDYRRADYQEFFIARPRLSPQPDKQDRR